MELSLALEKNNNLNSVLFENQKSFLETNLGKVVNTGLDIGLRYVLPNFIEEQVIDIKDTLLNSGIKETINKTIDTVITTGKNILGIFTGNFESIKQAESVIGKGGFLENVSEAIDYVLEKVQKDNILPKDIAKEIKKGKNTILKDISKEIEKNFSDQLKSIGNLEDYSKKWQQFYEKQDFKNMEKEFTKIEKELNKILPLEETIKKVREIENVHGLIKNKGGNFGVSEMELELAKKLT